MKITIRQVMLLMIAILIAGCEIVPTPGALAPTDEPSAQPIQVFFTVPGNQEAADALEASLLSSINGADEQIDVAMYNFNLTSIADGLVTAEKRGVAVRVVLDSDALDGQAAQRMQAGGVEIIGDRQESLMHNKFLVIDGLEVWSGSLNLTESGLGNDNNNMVWIESVELAALYSDEFNEMFELDRFGAGAPIPPGKGTLDVGGVKVEVLFSPDDHPSERLVELVEQAGTKIDFLAYAFTLNNLRDSMLQAHQDGLNVSGVFDESQAGSEGGEYEAMRSAGLDVRLDGIGGLMHDKVIILDEDTVVLGSYNFTRSADENNDENLLIIHDAGIARQYTAEFARIYGEGK